MPMPMSKSSTRTMRDRVMVLFSVGGGEIGHRRAPVKREGGPKGKPPPSPLERYSGLGQGSILSTCQPA